MDRARILVVVAAALALAVALALLAGRPGRIATPPATVAPSPAPSPTPSASPPRGRVVTLYEGATDRAAPQADGKWVVCDFHIRGTIFDYRAGNAFRMEPLFSLPAGYQVPYGQHASDEKGEWRSEVISVPEGDWRLIVEGTGIHPAQTHPVLVRCAGGRTPTPAPTVRPTGTPVPHALVTGALETSAVGPLAGEVTWVVAHEPDRTRGALVAVPLGGSAARVAARWPTDPGAAETNEARRQLSPDGRQVVLSVRAATSPAERDLVILDLASGRSRPLTSTGSQDEVYPAWSPDGTRVAFIRRWTGAVAAIGHELWIANVDGSGERLVRTYAQGAFPRVFGWTPDSRAVAYDPIGFEDSIYEVMDLASGSTWQAGRTLTGADWRTRTPAFVGTFLDSPRMPTAGEIRVADGVGATPRTVARGEVDPQAQRPGAYTRPRWDPTRDRILALREAVFPAVSVVALDGTVLVENIGTGRPHLAEWTPDGERVVYVTPVPQGTGPHNVLVRRLDGTFSGSLDTSRFPVGTTISDLAVLRYD